MAWVFLRHPDTGGAHLVPEDAVEPFEARGWVRHDMPAGLDADDPYAPALLADALTPPVGSAAAKQQKATEPEPEKPEPKKPSKKAEPSATEKKE